MCEQSPCQLVAVGSGECSLAQRRIFQPAQAGLAKAVDGSSDFFRQKSSWRPNSKSISLVGSYSFHFSDVRLSLSMLPGMLLVDAIL